jgi:hypothetical protein
MEASNSMASFLEESSSSLNNSQDEPVERENKINVIKQSKINT